MRPSTTLRSPRLTSPTRSARARGRRLRQEPGVLGLAGPPIPDPAGRRADSARRCSGLPRRPQYNFVVGNSGIADCHRRRRARSAARRPHLRQLRRPTRGFACCVDVAQRGHLHRRHRSRPRRPRTIAFLLVAPPTSGSITNTVTVDPNNAIFEADETNNTVDAVDRRHDRHRPRRLEERQGQTASSTRPAAHRALTEGFDPIATNGTDTYTIIVDNVGTQDTHRHQGARHPARRHEFLSVTVRPRIHVLARRLCHRRQRRRASAAICSEPRASSTTRPARLRPAGDDFATITIKVFATPFVQPACTTRCASTRTTRSPRSTSSTTSRPTTRRRRRQRRQGSLQPAHDHQDADEPGPAGRFGGHERDADLQPPRRERRHRPGQQRRRQGLPADRHAGSSRRRTPLPARRPAFFCTHDGAAFGGVITCTGGDFSGIDRSRDPRRSDQP